MPRNAVAYLEDILAAISYIREFTFHLSKTEFLQDTRTQHAVLRNLEVIGEAIKRLPPGVTTQRSDIEWKKIAGFRDFLIHAYFDVDLEIVWEVIQNKLIPLEKAARELKKSIQGE